MDYRGEVLGLQVTLCQMPIRSSIAVSNRQKTACQYFGHR